jgi:NAD-reducing hydrogenase small subunit
MATLWLDGCSGCHMSFLDMDERLVELASLVDIVYGPLVDVKEFPEDVDITLVEGAVSTREDWEKILLVRKNTKLVVSLGDCAVTGNVPAMRNSFGMGDVLRRAYIENVSVAPQIPEHEDLPQLIGRVRPVHEVIKVDIFVPGCPPPADAISFALTELLAGRQPDISAYTRFGR